MNTLKIRKNFVFDKDVIEQTKEILKNNKKSFTEAINLYFKAIIKEPTLIEEIEKKANKRTGSFIGMLDGKIGKEDFKDMKREHHEDIS